MNKIRPPRDYTKLKSAVVSRFLNFASTKAWVFICMMLSFGVFFALGIKDSQMLNYGGWWFGLTIMFIATPHLLFRLGFKYRDIPKGYTLEQAQALWKLEEKSKNLRGVSRPTKWRKYGKTLALVVGYVILLNAVLILVRTFDRSGIGIFVVFISVVIAPFAYFHIFRYNGFVNNFTTIQNAVTEVKNRNDKKKFVIALSIVGLIFVLFLISA